MHSIQTFNFVKLITISSNTFVFMVRGGVGVNLKTNLQDWLPLKLISQLIENLCCVRDSPEGPNMMMMVIVIMAMIMVIMVMVMVIMVVVTVIMVMIMDEYDDQNLSAQGTSCEWSESQLSHELPSNDLPSLEQIKEK